MFRNLIAEMARKGISNQELADFLGVNEKTVRNKLQGITDFTWSEVSKICKGLFDEYKVLYLFAEDQRTKAS